MSVTVVTPWRDHPELIGAWRRAVAGAEVVIVDNASAPETSERLFALAQALGGTYLYNHPPRGFAESNNQGLAVAAGDVVLFMNNDVEAETGLTLKGASLMATVARDVLAGAPGLYGPALLPRYVDGQPLLYLEGWCIAARRAVWEQLDGWDAAAFPGLYWEDNDLCFRAQQAGLGLYRRAWPVRHLSNTTTRHTPGAYADSARNQALFESRVRAARLGVAA